MLISTAARVLKLPVASVLAACLLATGVAGCDDHAARGAADPRPGPSPHGGQAAAGVLASYPSSIDALGGSVTVGFNTDCPDPFVDCPGNSWATGTRPEVDSIYLRLLDLNPQLKDHNVNDAASGTTMADLDGQASQAVQHQAELVTVAMGTNDACGSRTGAMTPVAAFREQFTRALDTLTIGLPQARVHVVSIPDLYARWESFHTDPRAMKAWRSVPFCPTLFIRPGSHAQKDVDRRAAVRDRVIAYNSVLAEVCAEYPQCTTDGGAVFRAPIIAAEFSTHDYWHPNIAGQATLAGLVWDTLGY